MKINTIRALQIVGGLLAALIAVILLRSNAHLPAPSPSTTPIPSLSPSVSPKVSVELSFDLDNCATVSGDMYTASSKVTGMRAVVVPLTGYTISGYCLSYPKEWSVRSAGAEAMNLTFNEGTGLPQLFLQAAWSNLPLSEADKATYSFEKSGPHPFVPANDQATSRTVESIGGKDVLVRVSSADGVAATRYFIRHRNGVYMFQVRGSSQDPDAIKAMIGSLRFVQ